MSRLFNLERLYARFTGEPRCRRFLNTEQKENLIMSALQVPGFLEYLKSMQKATVWLILEDVCFKGTKQIHKNSEAT